LVFTTSFSENFVIFVEFKLEKFLGRVLGFNFFWIGWITIAEKSSYNEVDILNFRTVSELKELKYCSETLRLWSGGINLSFKLSPSRVFQKILTFEAP
jgi:hypothetical protein